MARPIDLNHVYRKRVTLHSLQDESKWKILHKYDKLEDEVTTVVDTMKLKYKFKKNESLKF